MTMDLVVSAAVNRVDASIRKLTDLIGEFNTSSNTYSKRIFWLTVILAAQNVAMMGLMVWQSVRASR
jgi:hypothetical protein